MLRWTTTRGSRDDWRTADQIIWKLLEWTSEHLRGRCMHLLHGGLSAPLVCFFFAACWTGELQLCHAEHLRIGQHMSLWCAIFLRISRSLKCFPRNVHPLKTYIQHIRSALISCH